jgi:hypothetical protein
MIDEQEQPEPYQNALKTYLFKGRELEPFSFERQCIAEANGLYSGSTLKACTLIVFLCSCSKPLVLTFDGTRGKAALAEAMGKWAAENGITLRNKSGEEVQRIGMEIFNSIAESQSEPEFPNDGKQTAPNPNALG